MLTSFGIVIRSSRVAFSASGIVSSGRGYHASVIGLGRKGASAFVEKPRDFSKKQKKRFKKKKLLHATTGSSNSEGNMANELISQQLDSPETRELIETTGDSMLKDIREMMLPDGLQALLQNFEALGADLEGEGGDGLELLRANRAAPHFSEIGEKLSLEVGGGMPSSSGLSAEHQLVTEEQANAAVMVAAAQGKTRFVSFMFDQMSRLQIPVDNSTLVSVLENFSLQGQHQEVELFFDKALAAGGTPDAAAWSAYISATARSKGSAGGLQVLERVGRLGMEVTASAYTGVLQALVHEGQNDAAFNFWMRMKEDGVRAGAAAYEAMLQQCVQTYQVERAFNYLDEMRGAKVDLTVAVFEQLFLCCGSAPHWVNGYQDILFDAMALMEGAELLPSGRAYDNIISSFGRAGDAASAEFYFWEMRAKGIEQTSATYRALFEALASSQRVGASKYGVRPRYVRRPDKPVSELQRMMLKAGAVATANAISSRFSSDGKLDRGKRQYAPLVSTEDDMTPEEADEELLEELRLETAGKPNMRDMVLQKQQRQRALRDSETGRHIELSLLTRGAAAGQGQVQHIGPAETAADHPVLLGEAGSSSSVWGGEQDELDLRGVRSSMASSPSARQPVSDSLQPASLFTNKSIMQGIFNLQSSASVHVVVDLLDNNGEGHATALSPLALLAAEDVIPKEEIDRQWKAVLFGRSPDPDFSASIKDRRRDNITRADSLYAEMLEQGVEPSVDILSAYMSVASEAMQWEKANEIMDAFKSQHDISPDEITFRYLIRMHIFMSDISGCLERFDEMKSRGMIPDRETYGLLVATLAHRDDLVRAVQVLEEASERGIQISNRHIKKLRARFNKLNIHHPNIFPDPNLWVKELRKVRENKKNAPRGNKLQYLKSMTFA